MGFNKTFAVIVFCFLLPVLARAQGVTLGTGVSVGTNTVVPNPLSTSAINDKGGQVYNTKSYGLACNDSTDDTAALQALLQTVYNAGGGTIFVPAGSTCLISGILTLPNDGAVPPNNKNMRITGGVPSANGRWTTLPSSPAALDLQGNATGAGAGDIVTTGLGVLEIDHISLIDNGADCGKFIYTTNTTIHLHDSTIIGTHSGTTACNDVFVADNNYQGYGTYISHNFFSKIRSAIWLSAVNTNALVFDANTISKDCGSVTAGHGAITIVNGMGNYIIGNLIEDTNYTGEAAIYDHGLGYNTFIGNQTWDASTNSRAYNINIATDYVESTRNDEVVDFGFSHLFSSGSTIPLGAFPVAASQIASFAQALRSGTASNTDLAGTITMSAGAGSYTFTGTYTSAPICVVQDDTSVGGLLTKSVTTTTLSVTAGASDVIEYQCVGRN